METTKKHDIPLTHLDYSYIEKCTDTRELEKILRILRSGDEGKYPQLEQFCENRLSNLDPKSRALRKDAPLLTPNQVQKDEWHDISQGLQEWKYDMEHSEKIIKSNQTPAKEDDDHLPPIRTGFIATNGSTKTATSESSKNKNVKPRDYREWDKFDVDKELEKVENEEPKQHEPVASKAPDISSFIDSKGLSEGEKAVKAEREKDKGNEAFKAGDHEEAILYYSRSISLHPSSASLNNRALAYLKMSKWDEAILDCTNVLKMEPENIKALLRRGSALKSKKDYQRSLTDLEKVLSLEPGNKRAEELILDIKSDMKNAEVEKKKRKEKGRRMVIEEVDGEDEDKVEEIEVEKEPGENSLSNHEKTVEKVDTENHNTKNVQCKKIDSKEEKETPFINGDTKEINENAENNPEQVNKETGNYSTEQTSISGISETDGNSFLSCAVSSEPTSSDTNTSQSSSDQTSSSFNGPSEDDKGEEKQTHERPTYVQLPLSAAVSRFREEGNVLFRSGQYGDAITKYTAAITKLEKVSKEQCVNLSLLYSNRAACALKIGDISTAIKDTTASLELVPHAVKPLLRRGAAYEAQERYKLAYVDYKHALSIDGNMQIAYQGVSRCQNILHKELGSNWREKIPPLRAVSQWDIPVIVDHLGTPVQGSVQVSTPYSSNVNATAAASPSSNNNIAAGAAPSSLPSQPSSTPEPPVKSVPKEKVLSDEEKYEKLKLGGNEFVKAGKFQEAVEIYGKCVALLPEKTVAYTNRALCYLKMNMFLEAEKDCDKVLEHEKDNVKAIFRRGQARKGLKQYKKSLEDLTTLMKLDPKNAAGKKELEIVKGLYMQELQEMKKNMNIKHDTSKPRKRMVIEESDSDEEKSKPASVKSKTKEHNTKVKTVSSKSPTPEKTQGSKKTTQKPSKGEKTKVAQDDGETKPKFTSAQKPSSKKSQKIKETSTGLPSVPPSAPKLDRASPFEFTQAWNSLKKASDIQPYADLLKQLQPSDLPKVISNKLDEQMLRTITKCVADKFVPGGDFDRGFHILNNLSKVERFSVVNMFMDSKHKTGIKSCIQKLENNTSTAYSLDDLKNLKKVYEIK